MKKRQRIADSPTAPARPLTQVVQAGAEQKAVREGAVRSKKIKRLRSNAEQSATFAEFESGAKGMAEATLCAKKDAIRGKCGRGSRGGAAAAASARKTTKRPKLDNHEQQDRVALLSMFMKLGGESWTRKDRWTSNSPLSEWSGIQVNSEGRVVVLELSSNNLVGRLDEVVPDFLQLSSLTQLWLSENHLQGPLPSSLAEHLPCLSILDVGSNRLRGSLSPAFAANKTLTWFEYVGGDNQLTSFYRCEVQDIKLDRTKATMTHHRPSLPLEIPRCFENLWDVHVAHGLLSLQECASLVREAERYTSESGGWSRNRHREYATTDVDVAQDATLLGECNTHLKVKLIPLLSALFDFPQRDLAVEDMFVAKYSEHGQVDLAQHRDGSELSFVVTLNDPISEFEGGGTMFVNESCDQHLTLSPKDTGSVLIFCGKHLHAGVPIVRGSRYILTGFVRMYPETKENMERVEHIRDVESWMNRR